MTLQLSKESVLVAVLAFVVLASGLDLYTDLSHGASNSHIAKEASIVVLSTLFIIWILYAQHQQAVDIEKLTEELAQADKTRNTASEYILSARKKLNEVITQQFNDWNLTNSEKEVGWLLLKGLSLKEISVIRETLEKTVRQQASAIYKKAGLSGRHAFSAWFIEDLL